MITNLVNLFSNVLTPSNVNSVTTVAPKSNNPFASPFVSNSSTLNTSQASYGKNKPVQGGYFAGYYNGQPNIVGRKLFIEV